MTKTHFAWNYVDLSGFNIIMKYFEEVITSGIVEDIKVTQE